MFCKKCGGKIPDDSEFCYKCGAPVKSEPKQPVSGEQESSSEYGSFEEKADIQPAKSQNEARRCSNCDHLIYSWNSRCPSCGQPVSGEQESSSAYDDFEEKYDALKKGTLIAGYVIMGIVVIILFITGDLSDFSCNGVEYEVWYTPTAPIVVVGGALGLNIVRWIVLLIFKATYKK